LRIEEAIEMCCANGWQGFRADWCAGRSGAGVNRQTALELRNKAAGDAWLRREGVMA
jgi:hypothetical protein